MSKELERRIGNMLKLIADPTRRKILELLSDEPTNPQDLADQLSISRPAIEKHLKQLVTNYLCERRVEPFPSPHYVYFISIPGIELIDNVKNSIFTFFQSMNGIIEAEIEQLERDFVLGIISRKEYDVRKPNLLKKQEELISLQLHRLWIEEAKLLINEHQKEKEETSSI
ncbi:MAG: ArsR family transcriptional regulator [Candidatus Heimdallarchaeota archaeon]|nr:ArsR family transcriptional regulator [Candidatus Heimdallarchaeota archaeon]